MPRRQPAHYKPRTKKTRVADVPDTNGKKTRVPDVAHAKAMNGKVKPPSRSKEARRIEKKSFEAMKRESEQAIIARHADPGEVDCLGWCNKKFHSPNKKKVRYCPKCREKRDGISKTYSWRALMTSQSPS